MNWKRGLKAVAPILLIAGISGAPVLAQDDMTLQESAANNACLLPPPPPISQGNPVMTISWTTAGWTIQLEDRARNWRGQHYAAYFDGYLMQDAQELFTEYEIATHSPVR